MHWDDHEVADLAERWRGTFARAHRRLRQEARPGLPLALVSVLDTLDRHGPLTPSALARHERLALPNVSRAVGRLRSEGLVTTQTVRGDGRSYTIKLTRTGSTLLREARGRSATFLKETFENFDDADLAILDRAAQLLNTVFDTEMVGQLTGRGAA